MGKAKQEYLETSDKMMAAGKKVLSNANIPERFKKLVKREMRNQQDLMEAMGWERE